MKQQLLLLTAGLALSNLALSEPLSYDYIQVDAGIAESKYDTSNKDYTLKTLGAEFTFSKQLNDKVFIKTKVQRRHTDDDDQVNGVRFSAHEKSHHVTVAGGVIFPIMPSFHVTTELGLSHDRGQQKTQVQNLEHRRIRINDTGLYWAVGVRAQVFGSSEMEILYSRADEVKTIHIGGPVFLTKNLGLDIGYSYIKDDKADRYNTSSVVTAGIRWAF